MSFIRFAGRAMLGGALIADGVDALRHPEPHAEAVQPWVAKVAESLPIPDDPVQVTKAAAAGVIAGGAMIASGVMSRLGACVSSSVVAPSIVLGYPFWKEQDQEARRQVLKGFVMHLALLGGTCLVLAGSKKKATKGSGKQGKATSGKCASGKGRCCKDAKAK